MSLRQLIDDSASLDVDEQLVARVTFSLSVETTAQPASHAMAAYATGGAFALAQVIALASEMGESNVLDPEQVAVVEQVCAEMLPVFATIANRAQQAVSS